MLKGSELLSRARRLSDDQAEPYYIDDDEMYTYLSEAERSLAVQGRLLRDVHNYSVTADDRWIALGDSPEVIEFRKATLVDAGGNRYPMKLLGTIDEYPHYSDNSDYGLISDSMVLTPGRPRNLIFGKQAGYFEVFPPANADYILESSRLLYPKKPLLYDCDVPTIPQRHHSAIPIGAALLAIQGAEAEHFSPQRLANLEAAWQRALLRASEENGDISRDASPVHFTNDLWC